MEINETVLTDEVIERLILKKVLSDKSYMTMLVEFFDKRWFDDERIMITIGISIAYYKKYDKLPTTGTLKAFLDKKSHTDERIELADYMQMINGCINLNLDLDEKCIEDNIITWIKARGSYYAISDNVKQIETNRDTSTCIDRISKFDALTLHDDVGIDLLADQEKIWGELLSDDARISFGMAEMDRVSNGGIYTNGRALICFLAKTNLGKSLMLSNLAVNFAEQGKNVLIVSLEMSEVVYSRRLISHITEDSIDHLKSTHKSTKEKLKRIMTEGEYGKIRVKEFPPSSITVNTITNEIDKLTNLGERPDVIIVDYLSLLLPVGGTRGNTYQDVGLVAEQLRAISYKYSASVVTVCQTNRSGYGDDVDMESISESAKVLMTADMIIGMSQSDELRDQSIISGIVLKNRLGSYIGTRINFHLNPYNLRITTDIPSTHGGDDVDQILGDGETPTPNNEPLFDVEMDISKI